MKRIAVFPGSFDPITKGHESIVKRALPLFDEIIIAIGINSSKQTLFNLEQREKMISLTFKDQPQVSIATYQSLTVDFCKKLKAKFILRGLRSSADFDYEKNIAQMNRAMASEIETLFLITEPELSPITSTIVRDILRNKGDVTRFIPSSINLKDL